MEHFLPVNPHDFRYILKPKVQCATENVYLLIYIHSAPAHYKQRVFIRETWGNRDNVENVVIDVIFLVGWPNDDNVQASILLESDMYGDILQEDFVDSYRNLTYKGIMGLRWMAEHCSPKRVRYVMKTDDDIFVNIFNVLSHLSRVDVEEPTLNRTVMCLLWTRMKVVRNSNSKWYIPKRDFAPDFFPQYCSGSAFIYTSDLVLPLYNASLFTPFFWVDDYYVSGMLAGQVGAQYRKLNNIYSLSPKMFLEKFRAASDKKTLTFGHVHDLSWWYQVWRDVIANRERRSYSVASFDDS